jgi:hypothetical protein
MSKKGGVLLLGAVRRAGVQEVCGDVGTGGQRGGYRTRGVGYS